MSPSLKARSQVNLKKEVVKTSKREDGKKAKRRKTTTIKVNGSKPLNAAPRPLETENTEQKPEPVADDDHAFFDDEENAAYANFMLSIEPSELTTFSKKAKDSVMVPSTSKTKAKRPIGQSATHGETDPSPFITETTPPTVPDNDSSADDSATKKDKKIESLGAERLTKKADPDAKRRKASTPGWAEEDTGPERLPIKTRGGVLKSNARMQSRPQASNGKHHTKEGTGVTNYSEEGDARDGKEEPGVKTQDLIDPHDGNKEAAESDPVSEDEPSIYDSADSDEDYSMELDDHNSLPSSMGNAQLHLSVLRQRRLEQKKALMAELCETILGSPEESLMRPKNVATGEDERPRMEQLFALMDDDDHRVRHFAMLSQYAVFKDIIPSYRIRIPTTAEMATKVSKEVQRVRSKEAALLKAYQGYLKALEATIQSAVRSGEGGPVAPGARALASSAIRCMCGLLSAHPHFNFRSNLVRTVVAGTNHKLTELQEACCHCLGGVFVEDKQGEVSLEVTRAVAKFVKEKKFNVSEGTLRCLLALPLRVREDERARAKARVKSKNRKRRKEGSVEAGLMEADARLDGDVRAKCEADALHEVMLTYFRVLKCRPPPPGLFPVVMEGLAKFVHLVNLETVEDLLDLLKDLLQEEELPLEAALHCILAAFRALQGPGRELQTDEAAFLSALYRRLPDLLYRNSGDPAGRKTVACVSLVYDCLDAALGKRRELSTARVAAIIKRLLSVSLQLTQSANPAWGAGAGGLLRGAHRLLLRYPASQQLLENEHDRPGAGPFRPDISNPEHANALSSAAWELSLLRHSCEPAVAAVAADIVAVGSQDAAAGLAALYERGREAREAGLGQGDVGAAFSGVPLPTSKAVTIGKTSLFESSEVAGRSKKGSKGQQCKRVLPKNGVDVKSPLLTRLARVGDNEAV